MVGIQVVQAKREHLARIASNMCEADRMEIDAISGIKPAEALERSFDISDYAWTVLIDGRPEAMFGVGCINALGGIGAPWMLTTDEAHKHWVKFARLSVDFSRQLLDRYPVMMNVIDCRNKRTIRWMEWLGFRFSAPFKHRGQNLMMFELRADACVI